MKLDNLHSERFPALCLLREYTKSQSNVAQSAKSCILDTMEFSWETLEAELRSLTLAEYLAYVVNEEDSPLRRDLLARHPALFEFDYAWE